MPNSETITAPVACELLGISRQRLNQLTNGGWIKREARGQYDLRTCLQGYFTFLKSRRGEKNGAASRLAETKARRLELEIERREAQLIPREDTLEFIDWTVAEVEAMAPDLYRRLARHLNTDDERARMRREVDAYVADVRACADRIRKELR